MATFSWRQWTAITAGVLLFGSLFFINRRPTGKDAEQNTASNGHAAKSISIDSIFSQAEMQVPASVKADVDKIKSGIASADNQAKAKLLDSIVGIYDSIGAQIPATYYTEKLASLKNSTELWYQAGDRYYKCAEVVRSDARAAILQRAIECFDNSLKIDSNNLASIVGKGECIVEGGGSPMEGIGLIEGVLRKDSNNEKALVALGVFSIQSAQYPKAIARFQKVLKIDPSFTEAYVYLAEASEKSGDKQAAITYLKKYNTFVRDTSIKNQINSYINKLESGTDTVQ